MSTIDGLDSLLKKFDSLSAEGFKTLVKSVKREGQVVKGNAKLLCPVDTGELRGSIQEKTEVSEEEVTSIVYTNKKHGPYVELGTGPIGQENHDGISPEINPTYSQKGWSYFDEEKEEFIHTRGQPAQPFMYPALKDYEKYATDNIKADMRRFLKKVCR